MGKRDERRRPMNNEFDLLDLLCVIVLAPYIALFYLISR